MAAIDSQLYDDMLRSITDNVDFMRWISDNNLDGFADEILAYSEETAKREIEAGTI